MISPMNFGERDPEAPMGLHGRPGDRCYYF
jgi:hypothetical protein